MFGARGGSYRDITITACDEHGLKLKSGAMVEVTNLTIRDCGAAAVYVKASSLTLGPGGCFENSACNVQNLDGTVRAERCRFYGATREPSISVIGAKSRMSLIDCVVGGASTTDGILVFEGAFLEMQGGCSKDNFLSGIAVTGRGSRFEGTGVSLEHNARSGILAPGSGTVECRAMVIMHNAHNGIEAMRDCQVSVDERTRFANNARGNRSTFTTVPNE